MTTTAVDLGELEAQREAWGVPGLQVVVVQESEVVHAGGLGTVAVDDPRPVTAATLFEHGSCTKAYTGGLGVRLAAEGLVDLDAPVRSYIPELVLPDESVAARVTVRDLLAHRSGLGRHDLVWILDGSLTRAEVVPRLAHLPLAGAPGQQWVYSNLGYALAGEALGRAAGSTWEELVASRLLGPLGMVTASVTEELPGERATGHLVRDGVASPTPRRVLRAMAPAGQLVASADDASRWLLAQLTDPVLQQTHEVAVDTGQPSPLPEIELDGYGLGWLVARFRGRRLVWHSGGVDGFLTQTLLLPDTGAGVLVSASAHMSGLPLAAALSLLDQLVGETGDWYFRLRPAPSPVDRPVPVPAGELVGTWRSPGYGGLTVSTDGSASLGDSRLQLVEGPQLHYPPLETSWAVALEDGALTVAFDETGPTAFERA